MAPDVGNAPTYTVFQTVANLFQLIRVLKLEPTLGLKPSFEHYE